MFARIICPHCKKRTPLTAHLLEMELGARVLRCSQCRKRFATNFHHRVHLTGYRLLALSLSSGFFLGVTVKLGSAFTEISRGAFAEAGIEIASSAIFFMTVFGVCLGVPCLYLMALPLQHFLDNASRSGRAQDEKRKGSSRASSSAAKRLSRIIKMQGPKIQEVKGQFPSEGQRLTARPKDASPSKKIAAHSKVRELRLEIL